MRSFLRAAGLGAVFTVFAGFASTAQAQRAASTPPGDFGLGYSDLGFVIGLGGYSGANAGFGARYEHAFTQVPELNNGVLGFELGLDYWHWSCNYTASCGATVLPLSGTVNYHFRIQGAPKFDPFVGVGLGYEFYSWSGCGGTCGANSGLYVTGRLGMRYFITPDFTAYADVGAGGGALHVGVTWKLGNK